MAILAGCGDSGPELGQVTGQVTLDGKPLTSGTVTTVPLKGRGARGAIDSEGYFTLESGDLGSGAVVGTHRVAVIAVEETAWQGPETPKKLLVPQRYTNSDTSRLQIEVKPGSNDGVKLQLTTER